MTATIIKNSPNRTTLHMTGTETVSLASLKTANTEANTTSIIITNIAWARNMGNSSRFCFIT